MQCNVPLGKRFCQRSGWSGMDCAPVCLVGEVILVVRPTVPCQGSNCSRFAKPHQPLEDRRSSIRSCRSSAVVRAHPHLSSRISPNKGEPRPPSSALRAADSKFMSPSSIQSIRRQSPRDAGALLGGSKGCGREMGVDAPLRDGF